MERGQPMAAVIRKRRGTGALPLERIVERGMLRLWVSFGRGSQGQDHDRNRSNRSSATPNQNPKDYREAEIGESHVQVDAMLLDQVIQKPGHAENNVIGMLHGRLADGGLIPNQTRVVLGEQVAGSLIPFRHISTACYSIPIDRQHENPVAPKSGWRKLLKDARNASRGILHAGIETRPGQTGQTPTVAV